jgi:hypothetical protein
MDCAGYYQHERSQKASVNAISQDKEGATHISGTEHLGFERAQIEAMPDGHKQELGRYIDKVHGNEFEGVWQDPPLDLITLPTWKILPGRIVEDADVLTDLKQAAGGWFYVKGEN